MSGSVESGKVRSANPDSPSCAMHWDRESESKNWHYKPHLQSVPMRPVQANDNLGGITMPDREPNACE